MLDRSSPLRFLYQLVLAAVIGFAAFVLVGKYLDSRRAQSEANAGGKKNPGLLEYERNTMAVFQEASPAVVFVHNLQQFRDFRSLRTSEVQAGTGSGFLWDREGHIVTNFHVVQNATRVAVTLIDGNTYEAKRIGFEARKDLAVLKIELRETNVIPFVEKVADSSKILVGQKAIAIGNPWGLDHTLTVGNVSALSRSMPSISEGVTIRDMIQTDAPINPGNSGGPLLDSQGKLIGMNTLILRNSTGIGFAVPSNTINRIVKQIIKYGKPVQAGIGISIFDDQISRSLRVEGAIIHEVFPGMPADEAGLQGTEKDQFGRIILGDVIKAIDGDPIRNYDDMYNAFDDKTAGDVVEIVYERKGAENTISIEMVTVSE